MARLLAGSELSALAGALVDYFPDSLNSYSIVRNTADGLLDREVWVDQWPQFTALLIRPSKNAEAFITESHTIYKTPDSDVGGSLALLRHTSVLDWTTRMYFAGFSSTLKPNIEKEAAAHNCQTTVIADVELMDVTQDNLPKTLSELPVGIEESHLKPEEASFVTSKWPYKDIAHDAEQNIAFLINNFPTVSLRLASDTSVLIGWAMVYSHGALGMVYVMPEYRGRGFGTYLTHKIAKVVIDRGAPAFLLVERDNEIAHKTYMKLGFCRTNIQRIWIQSEPKSVIPLSKNK